VPAETRVAGHGRLTSTSSSAAGRACRSVPQQSTKHTPRGAAPAPGPDQPPDVRNPARMTQLLRLAFSPPQQEVAAARQDMKAREVQLQVISS
jgi:hypothetical protein